LTPVEFECLICEKTPDCERNAPYYNFYEDVFVGFNLNQVCVVPVQIDLYTDTFTIPLTNSYHSKKKMYCKLQGDLGNQLSQVASCFALAKKHEQVLILVAEATNPYLKTTFRCFNSDVQTDCVEDFKEDVVPLFLQTELTTQALQTYPLAPTSFFIHYRPGNDARYTNALRTAKADHYYVVADKETDLFQGLNVTWVNDSPLKTLYLMTVCAGGVCGESLLSWWGGYLNRTPGKVIVSI
jgi:hypothetical protein